MANAYTIGRIDNGWLCTTLEPNGHQHTIFQPTLTDAGKWLQAQDTPREPSIDDDLLELSKTKAFRAVHSPEPPEDRPIPGPIRTD